MASGDAWTFDHRHMPYVLEYDNFVSGNCGGHDFGATDVDQPVMPPPDDQCRHRYIAQPLCQVMLRHFVSDRPENPIEKIKMPDMYFEHCPHHEPGRWDALVHDEIHKAIEVIQR